VANNITIGDCFRAKEDNFVLLRVLAASAVIYGHSFAISSQRGYRDLFLQYVGHTHIAHVAVCIFFVISGFLVTGSYFNRHNWRIYIKARFLRLIPGLAVCLMLTVFVLGPTVTVLPLYEYFSELFAGILQLIQNPSERSGRFLLPGVFDELRLSGAVNGSLWTLLVEVKMYFYVLLFGVAGVLKRRVFFNFAILMLIIVGVFYPEFLPLVHNDPKHLRLAALFAIGAVLYINRDVVPLHGAIVLLLIVLAVAFNRSEAFMTILSLLIAYGTMWVAYCVPIPFAEKVPDNSYGIYIYAFPIQQSLVLFFPHIGPYYLGVLAFLIVYPLALASWYLVEKPSLRLKRGPLLSGVWVWIKYKFFSLLEWHGSTKGSSDK